MGAGSARTVVLLGNVDGSIWQPFSEWRQSQPHEGGADPLDRWSKVVIQPIADHLGAAAYYPSDKPWWPFQQWVTRAEALRASPLGLLIHPQYGLWHGYRGALGFANVLDIAKPGVADFPCDACRDKPCLTTCSANAVFADRFDVSACRSFLATSEGQSSCMQNGCLARNACPVGAQYRYPSEQLRFHMDALEI